MNVLVISDTHHGHPGWNGFGEKIIAKAVTMTQTKKITVALHIGDLIEPANKKMTLKHGLDLFKNIPAEFHLWVAGNNDIEMITPENNILDYAQQLKIIGNEHDVWFLDFAPRIIDDIAFVGNFGYCDFSLWRPHKVHSPQFPSTLQKIKVESDHFHLNRFGHTQQEIFEHCQKTLRSHLLHCLGHKIVLATHTVPDSRLLLYGESPQFDFQNAWMGWDDSQSQNQIEKTPGLTFQFCGHTHRSQTINRTGTCPLINISGDKQPFVFTI